MLLLESMKNNAVSVNSCAKKDLQFIELAQIQLSLFYQSSGA